MSSSANALLVSSVVDAKATSDDLELDALQRELLQIERLIKQKKRLKIVTALEEAKEVAKSVGFTLQELVDYEQVMKSEARKSKRSRRSEKLTISGV